ncbi:MAG: amidohydrolase family protein [Promethearchaeota archaeon]
MIINVHSHLARKELYSDKWWDKVFEQLSITNDIPKELIVKQTNANYFKSKINYAEAFVEVLDESGVDKALICGMDLGLSTAGEPEWSIEETNQWVANQANEHPDKLIALCALDPRRKNAISLLEKAVSEWDMIGVKFHPTAGFYPDDPKFFPFYKKCIELNAPIFTHTSSYSTPLMDSKYADPVYLDGVAGKFPYLKIIMIHFGGLSWMSKCAEIMWARPNIYAEISTHQVSALVMPEKFLKNLRWIMDLPNYFGKPLKERIMFGSDWPYFTYAMEEKDWVEWIKNIPETAKKYNLKFTDGEIKKILGLNAKQILKL